MARFWKKKIVLAKLETPYGVDAAPTSALNGILAIDVKLSPMEGQDLSRDLERATYGASDKLPVDLHSKLSFKVELAGSGTAGQAPAWAVLVRACAMAMTTVAATSVTFNPITNNPESVTITLNIDGQLYKLLGARGTAKLMIGASAIPYITFELTGLFVQPVDAVMPAAPDLTGFKSPLPGSRVNTPVFTVGGAALTLRELTFDFGNVVEGRFLIGAEEILITDKEESVEFTIEQPALSVLNPFALAQSRAPVALALTHGTVAGNRITLNVPTLQMMRPGAPENRQGVVEQTLRGTPMPGTAGNDQFTLVLT